jgi:hypothetical protein
MSNRFFWRALHSLAHPLTIGAVALALLNDHVLRQHWPSWWTGKLSDFAWLVFAPFLLAALLAWLIPSRIRRHEALIGVLAFGLTGVGFALAKTIPLVHGLAKGALETLIGGQVTLIVDPTDLITLPALLIGWYVWRQADNRQIEFRARGWVILVLGTLATVATSSPPPDFGIDCVGKVHSSLFAISGGYGPVKVYSSSDGGLTWQIADFPGYTRLLCNWSRKEVWQVSYSDSLPIQYRLRRGEGIDRSDNGGQSWTQEYDLSDIGNEARATYYEHISYPTRGEDATGIVSVVPGPLDAFLDTKTGHLIVAMGHDGVLVRLANGQWQWAEVGPYSLPVFDKTRFLALLGLNEFLMAGLLVILSLITIIQPVRNDIRCLDLMALALAWIAWGGAILIFGPAYRQDYLTSLVFVPALAVCLLCGGSLTIVDGVNVFYEKRITLLPMLGISIVTALLFLLPYVLWTQGGIQHHSTATLFAVALTATAIFAGQQYMKRLFHGKSLTRKRKKVDDADNLQRVENSAGGDE